MAADGEGGEQREGAADRKPRGGPREPEPRLHERDGRAEPQPDVQDVERHVGGRTPLVPRNRVQQTPDPLQAAGERGPGDRPRLAARDQPPIQRLGGDERDQGQGRGQQEAEREARAEQLPIGGGRVGDHVVHDVVVALVGAPEDRDEGALDPADPDDEGHETREEEKDREIAELVDREDPGEDDELDERERGADDRSERVGGAVPRQAPAEHGQGSVTLDMTGAGRAHRDPSRSLRSARYSRWRRKPSAAPPCRPARPPTRARRPAASSSARETGSPSEVTTGAGVPVASSES